MTVDDGGTLGKASLSGLAYFSGLLYCSGVMASRRPDGRGAVASFLREEVFGMVGIVDDRLSEGAGGVFSAYLVDLLSVYER